MSANHLDYVEIKPTQAPTAAVIWLHGLGADGYDFVDLVPQLALPANAAVQFIFPHAPYRAITINNGYEMRAWYDIYSLGTDFSRHADSEAIEASEQAVHTLMNQCIQAGIPTNKIVLAGFSQGGAIALHTGLRYRQGLGGILALSTYLAMPQGIPMPANSQAKTPILMMQGTQDEVVPMSLAQAGCRALQQAGYPVQWQTYPMGHTLCWEQIEVIGKWLRQTLDLA